MDVQQSSLVSGELNRHHVKKDIGWEICGVPEHVQERQRAQTGIWDRQEFRLRLRSFATIL